MDHDQRLLRLLLSRRWKLLLVCCCSFPKWAVPLTCVVPVLTSDMPPLYVILTLLLPVLLSLFWLLPSLLPLLHRRSLLLPTTSFKVLLLLLQPGTLVELLLLMFTG